MMEPSNFSDAFHVYRNQLGYGFVSAAICAARHWQRADSFRETVSNAFICGVVAFGVEQLLKIFGLNGSDYGYVASVMIGYIGVDSVIGRLSQKIYGVLPKDK